MMRTRCPNACRWRASHWDPGHASPVADDCAVCIGARNVEDVLAEIDTVDRGIRGLAMGHDHFSFLYRHRRMADGADHPISYEACPSAAACG